MKKKKRIPGFVVVIMVMLIVVFATLETILSPLIWVAEIIYNSLSTRENVTWSYPITSLIYNKVKKIYGTY